MRARNADGDFARARDELRILRALLGAASAVPVVDDQLDAIDTLAEAGGLASRAAWQVGAATGAAIDIRRVAAMQHEPIADLRRVHTAVERGSDARCRRRARRQRGAPRRCWPPVAGAGARAARRLRRARAQGAASLQGVGALIAFAGGDGPRRYLVLSQNPAEAAPDGRLHRHLRGARGSRRRTCGSQRYRSIESWYFRRAGTPSSRPADAPRALRLPAPSDLADARQRERDAATGRPRRGSPRGCGAGAGRRPVDGVISLTPDLVARVLKVLGPVRVPGYAGTVTSANVVAALDMHTHTGARARAVDRRPFGIAARGARAQALRRRARPARSCDAR